jgi:Zn-dependent protease
VGFDPLIVVIILPVLVLSVVVHECAHGLAAWALGDPTARERGRLTLNPLPHVHPVGSLLVPVALLLLRSPVLFGWARPVPVDPARMRNPRDGMVWVALAGPASNALLALAFGALARAAPAQGFLAPLGDMALAGVVFNCALGLFNLIPIPPLDGSWVIMRFLPLRHILALHTFRLAGLALVAVLLATPAAGPLFHAPLRAAVTACLAVWGVSAAGLPL